MNFLRKPAVRILCLWVALAAVWVPARAADLLPPKLRELAASATQQATWPRLRSFAKAQNASEWSGWAYFLVGYREFEGHSFPQAAADLAEAARTGFSLADYATFYQASALGQASRPQDAAVALEDFTTRFPRSPLRYRVLTLRANALQDSQQAEQAVDALRTEPDWRKRSPLALLLGQILVKAQRPAEAALAFQEVYYKYPVSPEAKNAGDALTSLRAQLGANYPVPAEDVVTGRVEALVNAGRYDDGLKEYGELLKETPSSPRAPAWQLGQARCLLHLHRSADALQALSLNLPPSELDAQRLLLLIQVHAQQADALGIAADLARVETSYATSTTYADALSAAGMFYYRQLDWQEAAREYRRLGEFFPQSSHLREDKWRLAWCDYLLADAKTPDAIRQFLTAFPDSSHAPAALYWWGRIQEEQGVLSEARAIYAVLAKRFVHSYYAPKAAARLDALHAQAGNPSGASDSTSAPQAAALTSMLASPVAPASLACLATTPTEAARPALILRALDLKDVEGDFLRGALSGNNPPAELRLLLAELYATQNNPSSALVGALKIAPAYPQMEFSVLPKEVWDFLYPHTYWPLVQRQARLNKVDPYLVMGLIRQESAFNKGALSVANARGLMQLLPETAAHSTRRSRTRTAARRLNDPAYNVRSGCAYLAALLKMFDGRPEYALAAYNAGDFRVKDWTAKYSFRDSTIFLESIPIPATRSYVELVLRDAEVYRQLLTGSAHFAVCPLERASAPAHQAGVATRPHVPAGPVARPAPQH